MEHVATHVPTPNLEDQETVFVRPLPMDQPGMGDSEMLVLSILLLCFAVLGDVSSHENFNEELLIKELGGGFTAFHFQFVSRTPEYEQPSKTDLIVYFPAS
ncbi:hypothetical protein CSKR_200590 [Clonorchis sinensis]|uniref:Uncharacterized protein n=1 Tax=Clonorchis sinensis TaxID=79923 RepID=A0A419PUC0_CLOSI|nr:hypothetical protein CSKR_200590 [Clonorchis sinensis]